MARKKEFDALQVTAKQAVLIQCLVQLHAPELNPVKTWFLLRKSDEKVFRSLTLDMRL